jgi:hypothetical protein
MKFLKQFQSRQTNDCALRQKPYAASATTGPRLGFLAAALVAFTATAQIRA